MKRTVYTIGIRYIASLLALNVLDAGTTLYSLQQGYASEVNPLMAAAYRVNPLFFLIAKFSFLGVGLVILAQVHTHRSALKALRTLNYIYLGVVLWNVANILYCTYR